MDDDEEEGEIVDETAPPLLPPISHPQHQRSYPRHHQGPGFNKFMHQHPHPQQHQQHPQQHQQHPLQHHQHQQPVQHHFPQHMHQHQQQQQQQPIGVPPPQQIHQQPPFKMYQNLPHPPGFNPFGHNERPNWRGNKPPMNRRGGGLR